MSEYQLLSLGQICSLIKDGTHGTHPRQKDGIPLISAKDIQDGRITISSDTSRISREEYETIHRTYEIKEDDLLISLVGSIGRCALVTRDHGTFSAQRSVGILRSDRSRVDPKYLYHATCDYQFQQQLLSRSKSTAQAGVYLGELAQCSIPLPPLPEQKKIAEILSGIDQRITLIQKEIASLDVLKTAILEQSLERIKDCPVLPFHEVTKKVTVGIVSKPADHYISNGVPTLRSMNIKEGKIDFKDLRFISEESNQFFRKSIIRKGDLLTVRTGAPGTSAVAPAELDGANCVDIIISTPADGVDSDFLCLQINSGRIKSKVLSRQGGLAQQHFNIGAMRVLDILLPSLDTQKEISASVLSASRCIDSLQKKRAKYENIKFAVGDELLSGRKRVSI